MIDLLRSAPGTGWLMLGSDEHYGWERPRPARLVRVLAGPRSPDEFAWLRVPENVDGGPLDVVVRPRFAEPLWRLPADGESVQVAAWRLTGDEADALEHALGTDSQERWDPPKPLPDLWLWVES